MMRFYTVWGVVVVLVLAWAQWRGAAFANSAPGKGSSAGSRVGGHGTGSGISRHK